MAREHAIIFEESFQIPVDALTFEGFRRWVHSPEIPETGRIDYLDGDIEVDMSPEDLHTHGTVKLAIAGALNALVIARELGEAFVDSTRVVSRFASCRSSPTWWSSSGSPCKKDGFATSQPLPRSRTDTSRWKAPRT